MYSARSGINIRKFFFFVSAAALLSTQVLAGDGEREIAESPQQAKPLAVGDEIPRVTLTTPDYKPFALRDSLAIQPTILIYYRGDW